MINPDRYIIYHDSDPDLTPIKIDIHKVIRDVWLFWNPNHKGPIPLLNPNPKKMRNYGLPRELQYWKREEIPTRLLKLEKQFNGNQVAIWEYLEENAEEWKHEIEFIKKQWYHRFYGEWIIINEKPTWIPPWHWFFLSHWSGSYEVIDRFTGKRRSSLYPEYRDRDRRIFVFWHHAYTSTETFAKIDERGEAIPEPDGTYLMKDTGTRVCYGVNYPKHRRDGATQKALAVLYDIGTKLEQCYSSIIANKPATQKSHFDNKLIPAWRRMPFYFKPIHDGTDRPKTILSFVTPAQRHKDGKLEFSFNSELGSTMDFSPIIDRAYYDHTKITGVILDDENGKSTDVDIFEGWNIIKPSLSQGAGSTINPYAFSLHPSTVEEMEEGGGYNFKMLCDASDYYKRNPKTGQTESGLWNLFIPAWDGLENFIGPYGESIIDDPTEEQRKFIGRDYGAKEFINATLASYQKDNSPKSIKMYQSFKRKHPTCWADCWRMQGGDLGFNLEKLNKRYEHLTRMKARGESYTRRGDFFWNVPGEPKPLSAAEYIEKGYHHHTYFDHFVEFIPNENGRFIVSKTLNRKSTNLKRWDPVNEFFVPEKTKFIASADPVHYHNKMQAMMREDKSKASFAAGAIFYDFDENVDFDKPLEEWVSNRFVCTYMNKPNSEDEYAEEMLMACIYYGAEMFPETNIMLIVKHFEQRKHGGYLKYAWQVELGKYKEKPGFHTGTGASTKNDLFSVTRDYIEFHAEREQHEEIIEQWIRIKGKEEMTKFDLFVCTAGCLYGQKLSYKEPPMMKSRETIDDVKISDYYGTAH